MYESVQRSVNISDSSALSLRRLWLFVAPGLTDKMALAAVVICLVGHAVYGVRWDAW